MTRCGRFHISKLQQEKTAMSAPKQTTQQHWFSASALEAIIVRLTPSLATAAGGGLDFTFHTLPM